MSVKTLAQRVNALPLVELLAQAGDIGFHLVLARRVGGASRAFFEPVLQRLRELSTPGLLLDGDPGEGPLLGGTKAALQPPGRGLLVARTALPQLVQVAQPEGDRARTGSATHS